MHGVGLRVWVSGPFPADAQGSTLATDLFAKAATTSGLNNLKLTNYYNSQALNPKP